MITDLFAVLALSARDLRRELCERGIATAAGMDKDKADLMLLLITNWDAPQPAASSAAGATQGQTEGAFTFHCLACGQAGKDEEGKKLVKLLKCGKCNGAYYCSKECQVAAWPAHKQQCKELQMKHQQLADSLGRDVSVAYRAWLKRLRPLLSNAAEVVLFPAPHLPPRNRSHGLLLYVVYNSDTKRFKVECFNEITLEDMSARAAYITGGTGIQWPPLAPNAGPSEVIKVILFCSLGSKNILEPVQLSVSGAALSQLEGGTWKPPSAEETLAMINMPA